MRMLVLHLHHTLMGGQGIGNFSHTSLPRHLNFTLNATMPGGGGAPTLRLNYHFYNFIPRSGEWGCV